MMLNGYKGDSKIEEYQNIDFFIEAIVYFY